MKDQLYMLRPGYFNATRGPLYCSDSIAVEGLLSFCPQLRTLIDVHYIEFPRPRAQLVSLLGENHQSIPVLILTPDRRIADVTLKAQQINGLKILDDERLIRQYLSTQYRVAQAS